ncbi:MULTISPECIES: tRNA lysidine(34) synthetase TilS [unclassified Sphingomonas]|uniref:tRNA lysidine(34) synthetase TilS n=1 Tax=unclassified Sphingomonas TaxID=196159 RepID=UPI0021514F37|nr:MULTISPECIES: tRNA lysidine(34) synthetase TilS [unclassified Sphingomonas]MCR5869908.1 tRNA lysidine(34) synthetase TilS [Sphingomonas sp. J344]UUX98394.1 tRNA lysidine(34) synthetase TilS [Sphingomonas sp. J315]
MSPPAVPPASAADALNPLDPAWVERFRADFDNLCVRAFDGALAEDARIALAVSGGADSMAMLLLASAAFPGRVVAATVDHGLRPEAADEAAMVAEVCAQLGVPHATLTPAEPISGSSLQGQARAARYAALFAWMRQADALLLLTAHHADDQAETLLMRLNRASGVAGLSGIRPVRHGEFPVLRPLLEWRRDSLRAIVAAAGTVWVDDPSNADLHHDRTRFRELLASQTLLDPAALARSVAHIAETNAALDALVAQFWAERWDDRGATLRARDLPREVQRRLVRQAVRATRDRHHIAFPLFTDSTNIESLLDALARDAGATQAGVQATAKGEIWHFRSAPPRRSL